MPLLLSSDSRRASCRRQPRKDATRATALGAGLHSADSPCRVIADVPIAVLCEQ